CIRWWTPEMSCCCFMDSIARRGAGSRTSLGPWPRALFLELHCRSPRFRLGGWSVLLRRREPYPAAGADQPGPGVIHSARTLFALRGLVVVGRVPRVLASEGPSRLYRRGAPKQ